MLPRSPSFSLDKHLDRRMFRHDRRDHGACMELRGRGMGWGACRVADARRGGFSIDVG